MNISKLNVTDPLWLDPSFDANCNDNNTNLADIHQELGKPEAEHIRKAFNRHGHSVSPSTCRSDDSGIDRTNNLSPVSPVEDDLDEIGFFSDDLDSPEDCWFKMNNTTGQQRQRSKKFLPSSPNEVANGAEIDQEQQTSFTANRFGILSYEQTKRLYDLLVEPLVIKSRELRYSPIRTSLFEMLTEVSKSFKAEGIPMRQIRINGGVASHIIGMEKFPSYNDIDILIPMNLSSDVSLMHRVKSILLDVVGRLMPTTTTTTTVCPAASSPVNHFSSSPTSSSFSSSSSLNSTTKRNFISSAACFNHESSAVFPPSHDATTKERQQQQPGVKPTPHSDYSASSIQMREAYIYKQFRKFHASGDCWSLVSLGIPSPESKVVEFKFVDRMERQFEFTVDSFQVNLDTMLAFCESQHTKAESSSSMCYDAKLHLPQAISRHFYPTVVAECVSGSFAEASYHLDNQLITTKAPETIRGGGLLKYCRLLVSGYRTIRGLSTSYLERYMCTRFFIDFRDVPSQNVKIRSFLDNHFQPTEFSEKTAFLRTFHRVASGSSICLMNHERCQTLQLVLSIMLSLKDEKQASLDKCINLDTIASGNQLHVHSIHQGTRMFNTLPRNYFSNQHDSSGNSTSDGSNHGPANGAYSYYYYSLPTTAKLVDIQHTLPTAKLSESCRSTGSRQSEPTVECGDLAEVPLKC